ncbi:MAG: hypothetical protein LBH46_02790 [Rickettsiales bacterium]|jgi:hypothetical protein|nr:hypothetical protein [Rickettsiales bacterium]
MGSNLYDILEKVRKTLSYLAPAIIGIVYIWLSRDVTLYTTATIVLLDSVIDYVELFIPERKKIYK